MSSITESMAITRHSRSHPPGVAALATGTATVSNKARSGASPRRVRAWEIAPVLGTVHCRLQVRANRSPFTSLRITSS